MPAKEDEIGGLWIRRSQRGDEFLSGKLTIGGQAVEVVVFRNTYKQEGESTPDWRVYRSQPREGGQPQGSLPQNGRSGPPQGGYRAAPPSGRQVGAAVAAQGPGGAVGGRSRPAPSLADDLDDAVPF